MFRFLEKEQTDTIK